MVISRLVALILLSLVAASACSDEVSKRDRILRYYEATGVLDSIDRSVVAMVRESRKIYAGYPAEFWAGHDALFRKYRTDLVEVYVQVADEHLSSRELDALLEFIETDLGKKYLDLNLRLEPLYDEGAAEAYGEFMGNMGKLVVEYAPGRGE